MELSSSPSSAETWKLFALGSLVGCSLVLIFLNQSQNSIFIQQIASWGSIQQQAYSPPSSIDQNQVQIASNPGTAQQADPPPPPPPPISIDQKQVEIATRPGIVNQADPPPISIDQKQVETASKPGISKQADPPSTIQKQIAAFDTEQQTNPPSSDDQNLVDKISKVNSTINATIVEEESKKQEPKKGDECNYLEGRWVQKSKAEGGDQPYYGITQCPFIEQKFSCQKNGRPDSEYERWSWEATNCAIPSFDGKVMLEKLKNKRMILVGDSLNRNQWESLACLLYISIPPSTVELDAAGPGYKILKAKDYNFTLEFFWSPFIVEVDDKHESGKKVLQLEKLPASSQQWLGADVMLFNSGHWWTHIGKLRSWDLFLSKGKLLEEMPIEEAYKEALQTWAKWVSTNVDPKKTKVFFRSISPAHHAQWCYNTTKPIMDESYTGHYPKSLINTIESQIDEMNGKMRRVKYLNVTKLSQYRRDAHPSIYRSTLWRDEPDKIDVGHLADCSHWCLPGLPDTWNRLFYAYLFFDPSP